MPKKAVQRPVSEQQAAAGGVASVDRALSLLGVFTTEHPVLTLSELADRTRQYKSTVLRLLASLENSHLVRRHEDGRFGLGAAIARLHAVYASSFSLGEAAEPVLQQLVSRTRESAAFHVLQGNQDLCLKRIDSAHTVRDHTRAGDLQPLGSSIGGGVLRAYSGATGARHERIRRDQCLVADGDIVPELAGISAPVFGAGGELAGALVLTMPSTRMRADHAAEVRQAARQLTLRLGGTYPAAGGARAGRTGAIRGNPR
jgi:DNA-binding IclR family transcriptional regulator